VTAGSRTWSVRLAAAADADVHDILRWTTETFGTGQARAYAETLSAAVEALTAGPGIVGVRSREDIAEGLFTLHVARNRRKGRHFLIFRLSRMEGREVIEVLRILHDAMDISRHLPPPA